MKNCKLFTKVLFIKFVKKNYLMKTYFISWFVALTYFSCTNEKKSDTIAYESNPRPVIIIGSWIEVTDNRSISLKQLRKVSMELFMLKIHLLYRMTFHI